MYRMSVIDESGKVTNDLMDLDAFEKHKEFQLVSIMNHKEAIYEIREKKVELVFISVTNGQEAKIRSMKKLIKECQRTCFIFIGENCTFGNARTAFRVGAFDYIQYPLREDEVEHVLARVEKNYFNQYVTETLIRKINALIDHVFLGGGAEGDICEDIILEIYGDSNKDDTEKQVMVEAIKEKIYLDMIYKKPWLEKFTLEQKFIYAGEFKVKEKRFIINEWKSDFTQIVKVIRKYQMLDNKLIYNIGKYIVVHVDEHLTLDDLSESVYLNKSYISHIFKKVSGISLMEFMVDVKIDRAKILLSDTERKIYEVAEQIGYNDVEYFRKKFKDSTGLSPTEYRKNQNILGVSA